MATPDDRRYTDQHEWALVQGTDGTSTVVRVGITDHAQAELTDVVFVELPKVGTKVEARGNVAVVESVKAASDVYSPAGGEVVEGNQAIADDPSLINRDPEGEGWFFKLRLQDQGELEGLMDEAAYREWAETL